MSNKCDRVFSNTSMNAAPDSVVTSRTNTVVVIPVKDDHDGLRRALASIREDVGSVDVLIVDDGSLSPVKVESTTYAVRVVRFDHCRGIEAALNEGIQLALNSGYEFIGRLDAGDYAEPNRFRRQREYLTAHPEVLMVTSYTDCIDPHGRLLFTLRPPVDSVNWVNVLRRVNCLIHPAVMYPRQTFERVGLYSIQYPAAEDYEFFLRIASTGQIHVIPEVLTRYTLSATGVSVIRRRTQLYSRLHLQILYFAPSSLSSYVGLLQSLIVLCLPRNLLVRIKKVVY